MSFFAKRARKVYIPPYIKANGKRVKGHWRKKAPKIGDQLQLFSDEPHRRVPFDRERFFKAVSEGRPVRIYGAHGSHSEKAPLVGMGRGGGYFGTGLYASLYDRSGVEAHRNYYRGRSRKVKLDITLEKPIVLDGDKFTPDTLERMDAILKAAFGEDYHLNPDLIDTYRAKRAREIDLLIGELELTDARAAERRAKFNDVTEKNILHWAEEPTYAWGGVGEAKLMEIFMDYGYDGIVYTKSDPEPDFEHGSQVVVFDLDKSVTVVDDDYTTEEFDVDRKDVYRTFPLDKSDVAEFDGSDMELVTISQLLGRVTDERRQKLRKSIIFQPITKADEIDIAEHAASITTKRLQDAYDDAYLSTVGALGRAVRRTTDRMLGSPYLVELIDSWYRGDFTNWDDKLRRAGKELRIRPERLAENLTRTFLRGTDLPNKVALRPIEWNPKAITPQAVQWANARAGEMVVSISDDMERTIRNYVAQTVQGDMDLPDLKRTLGWSIKLDPRRADAVERLRTKALKEGRTKVEANRVAREYSERLLASRADAIARTETMNALNFGQRAYWVSLANEGLIPIDKAEWRWDNDLEPCVTCRAMAGAKIPFDGDFIEPSTGRAVPHPPLHPNCRCTLALVTPGVADLSDLL